MKKHIATIALLFGLSTLIGPALLADLSTPTLPAVDAVELTEVSPQATNEAAVTVLLEKLADAQATADSASLTDGQEDVVSQVGGWVGSLFTLIGGASIAAAIFPQGSKAGRFIAFVRALIDAFAFNWMNAKNQRKDE